MKTFILLLDRLRLVARGAREKKELLYAAANEVAVIKTNEGEMGVQFWTDAAPDTSRILRSGAQGLLRTAHLQSHRQMVIFRGADPQFKESAKEDLTDKRGLAIKSRLN